jgi:hypothetical protein
MWSEFSEPACGESCGLRILRGGGGHRTFCLGPHSEFGQIYRSDFGGGGNGRKVPNLRVGKPKNFAEGDSGEISKSPNFGEMLEAAGESPAAGESLNASHEAQVTMNE